jgi:histidine phosphotransferase ChpT
MIDFGDMRLTELLCSRLCHELASPVGAINNGIEMIEEFDDSMLPDALPLIGSSAKLVAARLSFYRMAYGSAGTTSIPSFGDMQSLADSYFEEARTSLVWPNSPIAPELEDGWAKLLLNMLPLSADTLPRGGTLTISTDEADDGMRVAVTAMGETPRISDECRKAMAVDALTDGLTPRSVHAYFVCRLAQQLHSTLDVEEAVDGQITFSVQLKR